MGSSTIPTSGGVTQKVDVFTATGTWTAPANCVAAEIFAVAGGGGGGSATGGSGPAFGGGGGG